MCIRDSPPPLPRALPRAHIEPTNIQTKPSAVTIRKQHPLGRRAIHAFTLHARPGGRVSPTMHAVPRTGPRAQAALH
eukprot:1587468-Prymnesium_polylepis.1